MAIKILAGIAKDGTNEGARVSAAVALLDRGWGKPPQAHTGEENEGKIRVTIRHIRRAATVRPVRSSTRRSRLKLRKTTRTNPERQCRIDVTRTR